MQNCGSRCLNPRSGPREQPVTNLQRVGRCENHLINNYGPISYECHSPRTTTAALHVFTSECTNAWIHIKRYLNWFNQKDKGWRETQDLIQSSFFLNFYYIQVVVQNTMRRKPGISISWNECTHFRNFCCNFNSNFWTTSQNISMTGWFCHIPGTYTNDKNYKKGHQLD